MTRALGNSPQEKGPECPVAGVACAALFLRSGQSVVGPRDEHPRSTPRARISSAWTSLSWLSTSAPHPRRARRPTISLPLTYRRIITALMSGSDNFSRLSLAASVKGTHMPDRLFSLSLAEKMGLAFGIISRFTTELTISSYVSSADTNKR